MQPNEVETLDATPFGVHFEEKIYGESTADTNTTQVSDDDTGTFRKDTDDGDT
jgi:hypothetical protein